MILLPGLGCGLYEILRKPITNVELKSLPSVVSENIHDTHLHGLLGFSRLSFGLEVLPKLAINLPDNIGVKIIVIIPYLIAMSVWFPFLPFIQ